MDSAQPVRVERRSGLRFSEYQVPVLLKAADGSTGAGFTLDLSCKGALLWTDFPAAEGQEIEIALVMPAAITLAEEMSVRCRARVVRLQHDPERGKPAVAVKIDHYEFLPRQFAAVQHGIHADLHLARQ
jgi:hypothetical protein